MLLSIKADGFVTAETLAKKLSMSVRQVQRLLAQLQRDNLITRKGGRKTGHWEVTCPPNVLQNVPLNVPQDDSVNDDDVAVNEADVVKEEPQSGSVNGNINGSVNVAENVAEKSKKQ